MSGKERVVFLDRAAFTADDLPIPSFDHNWSEYPDTEAADIVPRLFWATTAITHACPLDAEVIGQLHKLKRIVVTGPAMVDAEPCEARGIAVRHLPASDASGWALICLLEAVVSEAKPTL
jgi:lactate dehydrogenase-like 2-hydroxyacid dehydrogenase